jgi:putative oxidoreductase
MELGLLVLRLVVGLLFAGHGAQKLFGMFGGHGLAGTAGFFEQGLGLRPGKVHATGAGAAEFFGGLLLALGLLTPLAAAALIATMAVAIATVHWSKGVWSTEGGYEYNAVLMAAVFAITAAGPGALSLDRRQWGSAWAIAQLAAGAGGALAMVKLTEKQAPAPADASTPQNGNATPEPVGTTV